MDKRFEVGVLGATGMVGQQFIAQLADHPWFTLDVARRQRALARARRTRTPRRGGCRRRSRDGVGERTVEAAHAGPRPEARVLGARRVGRRRDRAGVRRRRPHRRQQRAQLPDGPDGAAAHPRGQRRPPRAAAGAGARREAGRAAIVTNPNCSTVVLAMALAPLRPFGLALVPRDDDAGGLGRGLPGRAVARHPRQRHPVHRRRGGEDRDRDRRRSSARSHGGRVEPHPVGRQRARQRACRCIDGHTEIGLGGARAEGRRPRSCVAAFDALPRRAAGARAAVGARRSRSSTSTSRTGRSRASTSSADGGMAVTRRPPAAVPGARLQVRRARPQHGPRRRGRGGAQRRADAWPRAGSTEVTPMVVMKFGGTSVGTRRRDRAPRRHRRGAAGETAARPSSWCRRCRA